MTLMFNDPRILADTLNRDKKIVVTSGGFDPIHVGHVRCILSSSTLANQLVVIVNGDDFLKRKKGYFFMPLSQRMEIVAAIRGVTHVLSWDDGSQYVAEALKIIRPNFFTKGGDRSTIESIAECERQVCEEIGCQLVLGVGGSDKLQSSSVLVKGAMKCQSSIKE